MTSARLSVSWSDHCAISGSIPYWHLIRSFGLYILNACTRRAAFWARRAFRGTELAWSPDCLFCQLNDTSINTILFQNRTCYVRYDNFPAAQGHVEIVPKRHVESFFDLTPRELRDAYALILEARGTLDRTTPAPQGYTIGVNEGMAAGRTIDHLHIHLIPRRTGDVTDPRGGIRQILPNSNPDEWSSPGTSMDGPHKPQALAPSLATAAANQP